MSQRNWIAALAFGLTVFTGAVLAQEVTNPINETERPSVVDQPNDPVSAQKDEDYGASKQGNFCGPSYTLNCGYRNQSAAQPRNPEAEGRDERDVKAQESMATSTESMALWTIVMAIAAIFSFVAASAAAVFAYNIIGETRRIGEAQTRAYLGVHNCRITLRKEECDMKIVLEIENTGNSPAYNLHAVVRIKIDGDYATILDEDKNPTETARFLLMNGMVAHSTEEKSVFPGSLKKMLAEKGAERVKFYIEGYLEYETVFTRHKTTEADASFCFRFIEDGDAVRAAIDKGENLPMDLTPKSLTNVPLDWIAEYRRSRENAKA